MQYYKQHIVLLILAAFLGLTTSPQTAQAFLIQMKSSDIITYNLTIDAANATTNIKKILDTDATLSSAANVSKVNTLISQAITFQEQAFAKALDWSAVPLEQWFIFHKQGLDASMLMIKTIEKINKPSFNAGIDLLLTAQFSKPVQAAIAAYNTSPKKITNSDALAKALAPYSLFQTALQPYNAVLNAAGTAGIYDAMHLALAGSIRTVIDASIAQLANNQGDSAVVSNLVEILKPYNDIKITVANDGTFGIYDNEVKKIFSTLESTFPLNYNSKEIVKTGVEGPVTFFSNQITIDNSNPFTSSASTSLSQDGSVFVASHETPIPVGGFGSIYEYLSNGNANVIRPQINPLKKTFADVFAVKGDVLAASFGSATAGSTILIFNRNAGAWKQTAELNQPLLHGTVKLAMTPDTIIVGAKKRNNSASVLTFYNRTFNRTNDKTGTWTMSFYHDAEAIDAIAADGNYCAVITRQGGFPFLKIYSRSPVTTLFPGLPAFWIKEYSGSIDPAVNPLLAPQPSSLSLDISHNQATNEVTVIIGYPAANSNQGAVYLMSKKTDPATRKPTWSALNKLTLLSPSYLPSFTLGTAVSFNAGTLTVSGDFITSDDGGCLFAGTCHHIYHNVMIMVYHLTATTNPTLLYAKGTSFFVQNVTTRTNKVAFSRYGDSFQVISPKGMCNAAEFPALYAANNSNGPGTCVFPSAYNGENASAQCNGGWIKNPTKTCTNGSWGN